MAGKLQTFDSVSKISKQSDQCRWREFLDTGDKIQAHDGRGWYSSTIVSVQSSTSKDILVAYDNYSSSYHFWCSRHSKRIRPTIGFLRNKIMLPQAQKISCLEQKNDMLSKRIKALELELSKTKKETGALKNNSERLENELSSIKSKFDLNNYDYAAIKKISISSDDNDNISSEMLADEEEIENMLMSKVEILSEWNNTTKQLEEIKHEINDLMSNNYNKLNIRELIRVQTMVDKRYEIQQQRLDVVNNNIIIPIMHKKNEINKNIQKYKNKIADISSSNEGIFVQHNVIRSDCKQLLLSLYDLLKYCNNKINEENKLNIKKKQIKSSLNEFENYLVKYSDYSLSYYSLLIGFNKFIILNNKYISDTYLSLNNGWKFIESLWFKWKSDDIISWIKYKMNWININTHPQCLDFDIIKQKMDKNCINGKSLINLSKNDLFQIGFKINNHRNQIYKYIKSLITKYNNDDTGNNKRSDCIIDCSDCNDPDLVELVENYLNYLNDDKENDDISSNTGSEGCTFTDNNKYPQRYICSLTNKLMSEPVICAHDNQSYEKNEIYQYMHRYGKLPSNTDTGDNECSINNDNIDISDSSSFLLFEDLSLKIEIEQFKKENNI